eukprot:TRINITY_DN41777_c0_g1_i1.p1 TRINITY_DN41777_c0_g1~~TRINITY_DN41777_c0_g1_i1.p1  ORF type:complete len:818 (+),score=104.57 TRINITY_DN41777_c0_g1_i1:78-2531(+)
MVAIMQGNVGATEMRHRTGALPNDATQGATSTNREESATSSGCAVDALKLPESCSPSLSWMTMACFVRGVLIFLFTPDNHGHLANIVCGEPGNSLAFVAFVLGPFVAIGALVVTGLAIVFSMATQEHEDQLEFSPFGLSTRFGALAAFLWALAARRIVALAGKHLYQGHAFPAAVLQHFSEAPAWAGADGKPKIVPGSVPTCPWWEDENTLVDITREEEQVLQYIESIACELGDEEGCCRDALGPWGMKGTGAAAGFNTEQLSFTSTRYHLAFCGYAASVVLMRCPCYARRLERILQKLIDEMLSERVWGYMCHHWPGDGPSSRPFGCEENVMWSGHVLMLTALYEALTGDDRYRRAGGLVARLSDSSPADCSDTEGVAALCARAMRQNVVGGMCCEPGLVFFQCQTHVHIGFRLLEGLRAVRGLAQSETNGSGDAGGRGTVVEGTGNADDVTLAKNFIAETERWENFALYNLAAPIHSGAFKLLLLANTQTSGAQLPLGHPGSDGWCLSWYFPWARSEAIPQKIWWDVVRPLLYRAYSPFQGLPPDGKAPSCVCSSQQSQEDTVGDGARAATPGSHDCCLTLDIPPCAWLAQLLPAAAQAGDAESVARIKRALDSYLVPSRGSNAGSSGCNGSVGQDTRTHARRGIYLREGPEWSTGSTANYLIGLAFSAAPSLLRRLLVEGPAPVSALRKGPCLQCVAPSAVEVFRARRKISDAVVPTDGADDVTLLVLGLRVPTGISSVSLMLDYTVEVEIVSQVVTPEREVKATASIDDAAKSAANAELTSLTLVLTFGPVESESETHLELVIAARTRPAHAL